MRLPSYDAQGGQAQLVQPASQTAVVVEDGSLANPGLRCPGVGEGPPIKELAIMGGDGEGFLSVGTSNNHAKKMRNEPAGLTTFLEF